MQSPLVKAAKPAAAAPAKPVVTVESLGDQLRASLPPLRLHSISLYNQEGDVLWLSEGALGPDEHTVVLEAMESLRKDKHLSYYELGMEDGRFAVFLPVRAPRGDLMGIVMLLTDHKSLPDIASEQLVTPRVRTALQKIAVFLRVGHGTMAEVAPGSASTSVPVPVLPPVTAVSVTPITPDVQAEISPEAIDTILTLELDPDELLAAPAAAPTEIAPPAEVKPLVSLHVQELVKLRSHGRTRRYEILARAPGAGPEDTVPAIFLADSANGPQGAELDRSIVKELLTWLQKHQPAMEAHPASFSVNLSLGALQDEHFLESVAAELQSAGVSADCLGFEIGETACLQAKPAVQRFAAECAKLGCFIVLDNFSFDSSMTSLLGCKALRLVKINSKLTAGAMREKLSQALTIAILQACKVLGIHCAAKGVETEAQLEWLTAVGCDLAQGFALEMPLSLESLKTPPALPKAASRKKK